MENKRPRGRERNNSGEGKGIFKRGATGNGPVGSGDALKNIQEAITEKVKEEFKESKEEIKEIVRESTPEEPVKREIRGVPQNDNRPFGPAGSANGTTDARYGTSSARRGNPLTRILIILLLAVLIYFFLKSMGLFGSNNPTQTPVETGTTTQNQNTNSESTENTNNSEAEANGGNAENPTASSVISTAAAVAGGSFDSTNSALYYGGGSSSGWTEDNNNGILNTTETTGIRDKFTSIIGDGQDQVAIYVYMCGTDLESKSSMATMDLQEMLSAKLSDNVKIVVFTGGCLNWQNDVMSSSVNEIYEISSNGLSRVSNNAGTATMVDPENLEAFIRWAAQNYEANRRALILWDHGGGSVTGYGYDEKYPNQGSMTLDEINQALENAGVKFDFIGFDACLMATAETALMCSNYADYLIASEETEPGIGWYYTSWLNAISQNTSLPTLEVAKTLIDDFTSQCAKFCRGQETTLSIVDLAELAYTLPDKLSAFAQEVSTMIEDGRYKSIARARSSSHEFAATSRIDQVDLVHFAALLGTDSGKALAETVVNAVKYNRTAQGLNNAYGLSIYFPYASLGSVDRMSSTYKSIGISDAYTSCIQKFAQMQVGGQASSGGSYDPFWTLLNGDGSGSWTSDYSGSSNTWGSTSGNGYGSSLSQQAMEELLLQLLGGRFTDFDSLGMRSLNSGNTRFLNENPIDAKKAAAFIHANILDPEDFAWQENKNGDLAIILPQEKWDLINRVDMAMFYDDGEGYFDLGLDNAYDFDDEGNLLPITDMSWVSIDDQPVAYYHMVTYDNADDDYTIIGRVPILLNGDPADLILVFDAENPYGYVAGFRYGYAKDVTEVLAKTAESLRTGDKIDFVCDYYAYDGTFMDSYMIGEQYTVKNQEDMVITNTTFGEGGILTYRFTDIYGEEYWTPTLQK